MVSVAASTSGCIDFYSTKGIFFPSEDISFEYEQGTIAEVRHNFTGGVGSGDFQALTQEEHFAVDNFYLGRGGGELYIWAQVHFGADTERQVDYEREISVNLFHIDEDGENILKARRVYRAPDIGRLDVAEIMGQVQGAEPGLWSLRVWGNGTASSTSDVPFYDWFQVTVNGRYSDDSYNNDAPTKGS